MGLTTPVAQETVDSQYWRGLREPASVRTMPLAILSRKNQSKALMFLKVPNVALSWICALAIAASVWWIRGVQDLRGPVPGYLVTLIQLPALVCAGVALGGLFTAFFTGAPRQPFIPDPLSSLSLEVQARHAENACSFSGAFGKRTTLVICILGALLVVGLGVLFL